VKLLAIETASDACSCALVVDDASIERHIVAPRRHAELVLPMVEELLGESGLALAALDALAFGRGPGSFTGLRVAAGVIQGLAYGADLPVVPVSSLRALAQGCLREDGHERVLAAFDARIGEVYWGAYEDDGGTMATRTEDLVAAPAAVPLPDEGPWFGVGEGWRAYADALAERVGGKCTGSDPDRLPRALDVAVLAADAYARGESVSAAHAVPVYVRNTVARKRGE
jgi:tRNA threonylcarbamoyladenosine biosynthesis protein TsaB